jgi:phosphatidylglycerol---prolipoprotein diacylglyceryl transferase
LPILSPRTASLLHLLFEAAAYAIAFAIYTRLRRGDPSALTQEQGLGLILGAAVGALIGAKLLAWLEAPLDPAMLLRLDPLALQGKTIVGGILGGWIGVEVAKARLHIGRPTGDAFAFALVAGIAVGRIGCFLAGLRDGTYGTPTDLPWGIDFGDGVRRHPTQLYEIAFLIALGLVLARARRVPRPQGELFLLFVAGYMAFRFAVENLKPRHVLVFVLSPIQIASLVGAVTAVGVLVRRRALRAAVRPERAVA